MKKTIISALVLIFSSSAFALPIFDQTVGFSEPIMLTVHPDSENPNQFWFYPNSYGYCGASQGSPEFSYKSLSVEGKPVVTVNYKLCPVYDTNAVSKAARELHDKNHLNRLSLLKPELISIDSGLWTTWIETFDLKVHYHCTVENKEKQIVSCQMSSTDEKSCRYLYNVFTGFIGGIANGYFSHYYNGVQSSADEKLEKMIRLNTVAFWVRGLQDHPELFSHGWKPQY